MSVETLSTRYPVITNGQIERLTLWEVPSRRYEGEVRQRVWSARLSTGLLGRPDCPSGNKPYAPKGENDIMLAVGDGGLRELIDLGFIPCPACHPENVPSFWEASSDAIKRNYPELSDVKQFADKNIITYDSRRVDWEALAPYLTGLPDRLYVPKDLDEESIRIIVARFDLLGFRLPSVGFYGASGFMEYAIKR